MEKYDFSGFNELRYEKSHVLLFNSYSRDKSEVLSNHHMCHLEYNGVPFNSTEQMFFILRLNPYNEQQEALLDLDNPKEIKKKGEQFIKRLKIVEDPEKLVQVLRFCLWCKYQQCEEFRKFLNEHPNDILVEYAPWGDRSWGMADEDKTKKFNWRYGSIIGKNICGRLIQDIRDQALNGGVKSVELPEGFGVDSMPFY